MSRKYLHLQTGLVSPSTCLSCSFCKYVKNLSENAPRLRRDWVGLGPTPQTPSQQLAPPALRCCARLRRLGELELDSTCLLITKYSISTDLMKIFLAILLMAKKSLMDICTAIRYTTAFRRSLSNWSQR